MRRLLSDEGGVALVLTAVSMTALLLLAALVMDFGTAHVYRARLQTAADAASLAGASQAKIFHETSLVPVYNKKGEVVAYKEVIVREWVRFDSEAERNAEEVASAVAEANAPYSDDYRTTRTLLEVEESDSYRARVEGAIRSRLLGPLMAHLLRDKSFRELPVVGDAEAATRITRSRVGEVIGYHPVD